LKLYDELAPWWPLISAPEDYADEAREYARLLAGARTVLELGSGGGNNASHLKRHFTLTLVEPSDGMRAHSVALNPECEHFAGDMRSVRLGRTFDAVFVHDAVCYMTSEEDLAAALATVSAHLRPGGRALLVPDATAECFQPDASVHGNDGADGRSVRFLEWSHPAEGTRYAVDYAIVLREASGETRVIHDRHLEGVFPRATWLRLMNAAGLDGERLPDALDGRDLFVAIRR
jgi:SAM-dependent methyltransferase